MFKINDYVFYGLTGVCQITDIRKEKHSDSAEIEYYILHPVYSDNMTIKIPVKNSKISMRAVLTKDEALALIKEMPDKETIWIDNCRERSQYFKAVLKTKKSEEWIKLVKTIYLEKEARAAIGQTLTKTDENIMNTAEKYLNEELAIALNISPEEVVPCILEHISLKSVV